MKLKGRIATEEAREQATEAPEDCGEDNEKTSPEKNGGRGSHAGEYRESFGLLLASHQP